LPGVHKYDLVTVCQSFITTHFKSYLFVASSFLCSHIHHFVVRMSPVSEVCCDLNIRSSRIHQFVVTPLSEVHAFTNLLWLKFRNFTHPPFCWCGTTSEVCMAVRFNSCSQVLCWLGIWVGFFDRPQEIANL